jgi:hypothetical protein
MIPSRDALSITASGEIRTAGPGDASGDEGS